MKNRKTEFIISLIVLTIFCCSPTTPLKKYPQERLSALLAKSQGKWTQKECDSIIQTYTSFNIKGYREKTSEREVTFEDIFIKATPLNKDVINAIVRKEAIQKRLPVNRYRERLKDYLESYTNWTLNLENGEIIDNLSAGGEIFYEVSFKVTFENISWPHRNIEVYRAEEGFFLENWNGQFSRVVDISGYDIDDYFILVSDLNSIITFSTLTDDGKNLFPDENNLKKYKLMFNGLQSKPIAIEWQSW